MSTSRVAEVRLQIRLPAELERSKDRLRRLVEHDLLGPVLDELEHLLHARIGSQVVIRIRHVGLRWTLAEIELGVAEVVARLARDLADHVIANVIAVPAADRLRPRGAELAVFASERHADAAFLADAADRIVPYWVHTRSSVSATWHDVVASGPEAVLEVVRWLREMDRLDLAILTAPEDTWSEIEAAAPALAPVLALVRARSAATRLSIRAPDPTVDHPPGEPAVASVAPAPAPAAPAVVEHATTIAHEPAQPLAAHRAEREATLVTSGAMTADRRDGASAPSTEIAGETTGTVAPPRQLEAPAATPQGAHLDPSADTQAAGLFYLVGRVLEIELAERLWAAGLPEGDLLALIAATVLGHTDDPAWRWFGGVLGRPPGIPAVETWAATEVIDVVQHALGRRLARFGISTTPATLGGDLDRLAAQLAPPFELPPMVHRLVSRSAAALVSIVGARLGREPSVDEVRTICARPGRLVLAVDALHVVMSARSIDVEHRRAGLDHDPGHVAWLGRHVRFELVGADVT